jgi:hypothetical protein
MLWRRVFHQRFWAGRYFWPPEQKRRRGIQTIRGLESLERRALLAAGDVLANHYTAGSTGEDLSETVLTPANVNSASFGKVFTTTLDGQVYAQILAVANVNVTRGTSLGIHNVLYAATMHNSLYAIDASTGAILWQDNFNQIADPRVATIGSPVPTVGVRTIPAVSGDNALVNSADIGPELGILATPTIDASSGILYLVADTQEFRNGATPTATFTFGSSDIHFVQRLWAVNISNGAVAIAPTTNPPATVEPTTGGQIIGDTIINPRVSGSNPAFNSYSIGVSSLTQTGGVATATISSSTSTGGMRVGDWISISGATPSGYNGNFQITAIPSTTTFQFNVSSALTSPATGTITLIGAADYRYVAGPYIKGTGNNSDTFNAGGTVATTSNADGWQTNLADTTSIFSGATPSASGYIAFNALLQMNRVATTLINDVIYLGFASHGDDGPYYGWLLGYDATTLASVSAFVTVPTFDGLKGSAGFTSVGGLWAAGGSITTDGTYLYFTVGNGSFNPAASNFNSNYFATNGTNQALLPLDGDFGDSVLKVVVDPGATQTNLNLANNAAGMPTPDGHYNPDGGYSVNGYGLKVVDYFTPSNVYELNLHDEDLGSSGVLLIPSSGLDARTAHFNSATQTWNIQADSTGDPMLVLAGKEGRVYLIDANNMGGFNTQYITDGDQTTNNDPAPYDRVLGEFYYFETTAGNSGTKANNQTYKGYDIPSYFNGEIYVGLGGGSTGTMYVGQLGFDLASFPFTSAVPRTGVEPAPNFVSSNLYGGRGTTVAISANGLADGIVWNNDVTQTGTDYLAAYSASATGGAVGPIYTSNQNAARDSLTGGVANATGVKFSIPTVFSGMVYVGTGGSSGTGGHAMGTVVGYGLLSSPSSLGIFSAAQDVGAPAIAGSSSYNTSTGIYSVAGAGSDISGTSDQFQYLYRTLTGDGTITAQVASETNTNSAAKAALMFRNSLTAGSADLLLCVSPSNPIKFEGRTGDGASAVIDAATATNIPPPYWIRLTRAGNLFTAYTSPDGIAWTLLGSTTVAMNATAYVGLAVTSHNTAAINTSTFQNVSIVPAPYIVNAAGANPNPVGGTSSNLSVLANEDGSGSGITYTWSATSKPGGANPIFSINGANAAQNTTVTFDAAGNYTFQVVAADSGSGATTSSVNVAVNQTLTSIVVSPATANLTSGQTQAFTASARDQFGNPLSVQPTFSWSLDSGSVGGVDANSGQYTAPLSPVGTATVRATSGAVSGIAAVNVAYLKGDVNINGQRDITDVMAMMGALADLSTYQTSRGLSNGDLATIFDTDVDTKATNADLQGLLVLLANGGGGGSGPSAAASPSTPDDGTVNSTAAAVQVVDGSLAAKTTMSSISDDARAIVFNSAAIATSAGAIGSAPTASRPESIEPFEPQSTDTKDLAFRADVPAVDHFFRFHFRTFARSRIAVAGASDDPLADEESLTLIPY